MLHLGDVARRVVVGRKLASDRLAQRLLPKRLALGVFASDPLSSVTYATQEILVILTMGGLSLLVFTPWVAGSVVILLLVVVASYRQLIRAYPTGGGDFEVAQTNLGPTAGMTVGSALVVDYVLTVAVSVAAGVDNLISAIPGLAPYRMVLAVGLVVVLAAVNLRGVRESGRAFAVPTYLFLVGVFVLIVWGLGRSVLGDPPVAESAGFDVAPDSAQLGTAAVVLVVLRAFAAGCTALTGVEAVANGVPAFSRPKSRNAVTTLTLMGGLSALMFSGITALAMITDVRYVDNPCNLVGFDCINEPQRTVIGQLSAAVFGDGTAPFFFVLGATALILAFAANTAFNGFPMLGAALAHHRYLPHQLHRRGDRLVFSNGILVLALLAAALLVGFRASVTDLIELYIVGVFTAFTLGQIGMVRHWNRALHGTPPGTQDGAGRRSARYSRAVNALGAVLTATVLVIVTVTKFVHGAWIVFVAIPLLVLLMRRIRGHYDKVAAELGLDEAGGPPALPSRVHAVVLVSRLHKPTMRALAYAKATRPDMLEAVTVSVVGAETNQLIDDWDARRISVPLKVLDSPYREIARPVVEYVRSIRRTSPRDVVTVYIPEYVVGHWWEHLLHNNMAQRLKTRLLFTPGVMVTSVPWQLESSRAVSRRTSTQVPVSPWRHGGDLDE